MIKNEQLLQLMSLLDVTRLQDEDSPEQVQCWLEQLGQSGYMPAAICLYTDYLPLVRQLAAPLPTAIAVATVVNFPGGQQSAEQVGQQIEQALAAGANEIDCVLPYQELMAGRIAGVKSFLQDVRHATGSAVLKVIIESGELVTSQQVAKATELVIDSGADFVKSSTGKVAVGLTDEAAEIMLTVIAGAGRPVGFKASGGIRTLEQGLGLMQKYQQIIGQAATPKRMRIGASALFQELVRTLDSVKTISS